MMIRIASYLLMSLMLFVSLMPCSGQEQEGTPFAVTITGKSEGPYNLRSTVSAPQQSQQLKDKPTSSDSALGGFFEFEKIVSGRKTRREEHEEAVEQALDYQRRMAEIEQKNQQQNVPAAPPSQPTSNTTATAPSSSPSTPSSGSSSSGPESHHHSLPTDGSLGADLITSNAIDGFYNGLPPEVTDYLNGSSGINLSGSDPYAQYARALQNHQFARMRELANSDAINNFNQRIAMLGLAGAAALNQLANPQTSNDFAAKDTLRKVAEDLHYAGEGLDSSKPEDAKLKTICAEISRIWSNMTNSGSR